MCRPVDGSRESGRTHRSAPTRSGKCSGTNGNWCKKRCLPQRGGTEPAPYRGRGAGRCVRDGGVRLGCGFRQPNFVPKFGASVIGIGSYEKKRKLHRLPGPAAHSGAFAVRSQGMGGNRGRDHPQRGHQRRAIPQSRPLAVPAPFAQGSLWGRGMRIAVTSAPNFGTKFGWRWLRQRCVGPAGLLAMTMDFCHSEERSDVGIRPFYDGRGFGPPRSSAPTERNGSLPRVPGQRSERGKRRWSNSGFARRPQSAARRTTFGSISMAPPVLT